jgi:hypothetical protein
MSGTTGDSRSGRSQPRRNGGGDNGVRMAPAPADAAAALSAADAVAAFEAHWGIVWRRYGEPEAELMLARNDQPYWRPARGEMFIAPFSERLVWVLTWHDTYPIGFRIGSAWLSVEDRERLRGSARLVGTAIVDAATGEVLAIFEAFEQAD